jgi:hypothetical protein
MTAEKTFYSDQTGVRITQSRAIFGAKTYTMNNVASVSAHRVPAKRGPAIGTLLIGLVLLVIGISSTIVVLIIFGILGMAVGALLIYLMKDTFVVRISSASGEADALASKDRSHIEQIVQALNEAIIARG